MASPGRMPRGAHLAIENAPHLPFEAGSAGRYGQLREERFNPVLTGERAGRRSGGQSEQRHGPHRHTHICLRRVMQDPALTAGDACVAPTAGERPSGT